MKLCFAFKLSEAIPYLQQGGGGYSGEGYWPMKLVHVFGYDLDLLTRSSHSLAIYPVPDTDYQK